MKTPMQQMLELLEELLASKPTRADQTRFETAIAKAKELIKEEKETFCGFAYDFARDRCFASFEGYVECNVTTEEYYNETFNTKKVV